GLADVERDLIRTLTAEGRSRAKAQGQHMGRRPKLDTPAAERGPPAARGRGYAQRTGGYLQCRAGDDFAARPYPVELGGYRGATAGLNGHRLARDPRALDYRQRQFNCPVINFQHLFLCTSKIIVKIG